MAELLWVLAGLAALLAATGFLCLRLRLPPALGYLLVGVVLPEAVTDARLQEIIHLEEVSHVAVLILLFFIGMELDLRTLRRVLRETRVVSVFNILLPALFITGLARLVGWSLSQALVLGIALSLSSTIFGERLSAGRHFPSPARHRMFGVLLAEDVAAGALLALMALLAGGTGGGWLEPATGVTVLVVSLVVLAALALLVVPRFIDKVAALHSPELLILSSGAFLLGFSAAGDWAGSPELGAFLAGMAAAEAGARFVVKNSLSGLRHISLAIFFFASGLIVDPILAFAQWPLVLACVVLVTLTKLLVHVPSAFAHGIKLDDSLRVGFGMATVGEFSLILLVAAQEGGIAHPALAATITGTIVGLLVSTPLLTRAIPSMARLLDRIPISTARPVKAMMQAVRREKPKALPVVRASRARIVSAGLVVLLVFAAAFALNTWLPTQFPTLGPLYLSSIVFGVALAVISPFALQLYRAYRAFTLHLFDIGERARGADRLKLRIADTFLLLLLVVIAAPIAFLLGASLALVLSSLLLAVIVAVLGWRHLTQLTESLEGSLARVLDSDADVPPVLLDEALNRYGWDFRVVAVSLPHDSRVVGQSIADVRLRKTTGATVAVIKRGAREIVNPPPRERFRFGDTVVLLGDPGQLARAEALLQGGEEPLRMAAESRAASVVDLELRPDSWIMANHPTKSALEEETGVLVLGRWRQGNDHSEPWLDQPPQPGDRIIALGTPLQISRLDSLASEPLASATAEVSTKADQAS